VKNYYKSRKSIQNEYKRLVAYRQC